MEQALVRGGKVWLDTASIDPTGMHFLKNDLTIIPKKQSDYGDKKVIRLYGFSSDRKKVWVPRGYYLYVWNTKIVNFREEVIEVSSGYKLSPHKGNLVPRDDQEPVIDGIVKAMLSKKWFGGLIEGHTGFGKTVCSIEIIKRIGRNTIVIVHTSALLKQWQKRIQQFCPGWTIGQVGQSKKDWRDKDVVIATIQSLLRVSSFPEDFWSAFGFVVCDEVHVFGAEKFGQVVPLFRSQYALGVSATLRRKDKAENVFRYGIGKTIVVASKKSQINPDIFIKSTGFMLDRSRSGTDRNTVLNALADSTLRNKVIAEDLVNALSKDRKILVMSNRLNSLRETHLCLLNLLKKTSLVKRLGFFIGGQDDKEREEACKCDVIFALECCVKEGLDVPSLDTLFMISPISDPEQAAGRVTRDFKEKKKPLVVDYVDYSIPYCKWMIRSRLSHYKRLGWNVMGLGTQQVKHQYLEKQSAKKNYVIRRKR